jgi:hypothetical protein
MVGGVMQLTKRRIILIVLLLMQLIPNVSLAADQRLQLEISLSKEIYILREPIWLDVTLTNITADTIRIIRLDPPCQGGVGIVLRDSIGREIPYTGPSIMLGPRKDFILDPGEQYYDCFNLLELYPSSKIKGLIDAYFLPYLLPGRYKVRAQYRSAYSQEIEFEVIEPSGDEREAYQLLRKAFTFLLDKKSDLMIEKFQEVVDKYPTSVYAEKAFKELFRRREMLQRFPNSGYNQVILRILTGKMPEENREEFLEVIVNEHPGSRAAKFAEQMIKMRQKESAKDSDEE